MVTRRVPGFLWFFDNPKAVTLCDEEGVPRIVQVLVFEYMGFRFWAKLFNGLWAAFEPANFCQSLGLRDMPNDVQYWTAWVTIEQYVQEHWEDYREVKPPVPPLPESWWILREALFS